jgi:hypothetical protein
MTRITVAFAALTLSFAHASSQSPQQPACNGTPLTGLVRDSTLALVPGASITLDGRTTTEAGPDGRFRFACVANGPHELLSKADGFASLSTKLATPHSKDLDLRLQAGAEVSITVESDANDDAQGFGVGSTKGVTLEAKQLQSLADDPDDLLQELQQLAAATGGGNPANTTISVDGFQGSSSLPPKSSIAYIEVNPDQFSAEYREPPFGGGRVNVYTKPGQPKYHGALYITNSSSFLNARNPFSTSKGSIGRQRYTAELSGPITKKGNDFALSLEHRTIDSIAVVNAFTLDATGNQVPLLQNIPQPQYLWLGTLRTDWQLGPKNTFTASFNARVNDRPNTGVGGTALASTGYEARRYDNALRFSDVTTVSAHLMHEARLALRWDGENDTPNTTGPSIQVAGAFTGGGSTVGAQQLHELNIEFDDDAILTTKSHTIKAGTQLFLYRERQQLTSNFNGTYVFGGSATQTGLQQYEAGTPTTFSGLTGSPTVNFTQVQDALFFQDDWNLGKGLHIASGLRYFLQTDPNTFSSITPRVGIIWAPGKKPTWTLHAHAGLFASHLGSDTYSQVLLNDGSHNLNKTVYNPACAPSVGGSFNPGSCSLSNGITPIQTIRTFSPHIQNLTWGGEEIGGTRTLPYGFNLSASYLFGRIWNFQRSNNINAPFGTDPNGPRPGPANLNILQIQNSGQGRINAVFAAVSHNSKRINFFVGGVRVEQTEDTNDDELFTPQNSRSDVGEFAHRSGDAPWQTFGKATIHLPSKLDLSLEYNGHSGQYYNITTGFDNNGDGNFNDRPQYALPGSTASTPGVTVTRYGLLVASGGTGVFPRNAGVMPWTIDLDTTLSRAFALNNPKSEHPQTLTPNLRTYNLLNHTNVTSVGGILNSPQFGRPYAADNARLIQLGLRYSF